MNSATKVLLFIETYKFSDKQEERECLHSLSRAENRPSSESRQARMNGRVAREEDEVKKSETFSIVFTLFLAHNGANDYLCIREEPYGKIRGFSLEPM